MKNLVLGLGNPILRDDGFGPEVARRLERRAHGKAAVVETSLSGVNLLDLLVGYDKVVIVDSLTLGGKPGTLYKLSPGDLPCFRSSSSHTMGLVELLELGEKMRARMPEKVVILGVEPADITTLREGCTPSVKAAIGKTVTLALKEIENA